MEKGRNLWGSNAKRAETSGNRHTHRPNDFVGTLTLLIWVRCLIHLQRCYGPQPSIQLVLYLLLFETTVRLISQSPRRTRLEKGPDRGIYPDRGTIPWWGYNKLNFFLHKKLEIVRFQKTNCRSHQNTKKRSNFCIRTSLLLLPLKCRTTGCNLCSIPNQFWESECSKLCSHNYMLFLGSGTDLGDSSYVKNVTLLKYWCNLQLVFYYLKISTFCEEKNAVYDTSIGYCTPIGVYPPIRIFLQPDNLSSTSFADIIWYIAEQEGFSTFWVQRSSMQVNFADWRKS